MIALLLFLMLVVIFPLVLLIFFQPEVEQERPLHWHRINGTHYVLYDDGNKSQPFSKKVAESYAEIFGGKVMKL